MSDGDVMNDQQIIDTIAEEVTDAVETVLYQHDFSIRDEACSCGCRSNMDGDVLDLHRISLISHEVQLAVTAALRRSGVAVIQLPEPVQ